MALGFLGKVDIDKDLAEVDHYWMGQALVLAKAAAECGEVPVGALVVTRETPWRKGQEGERWSPLAGAYNLRETYQDPTAHAELLAIRAASKKRGSFRLEASTLYVTMEPCAMCAGAIVLARIPRLVFGCSDPKSGAIFTHFGIGLMPNVNHRVHVKGGVRQTESMAMLHDFFLALRHEKKKCQKPSMFE